MMTLTVALPAMAQKKASCKSKKYPDLISCEGIEGAKRKHFCWKGEPDEEKKTKKCMTPKKKKMRKYKKSAKKG